MAEAVALAASIVGLAGAAATLSLKIYEFIDTIWHAKKELNKLAIESSDLSTVLDHLGAVFDNNREYLSSKTVGTAGTLVKRCESLLKEVDVVVELVKGNLTRAKWLLRKTKAREMRMGLESLKSTLTLMMQTVTLGRIMQPPRHAQGGQDQAERVKRNIDVLRSAILSNRRLVEQLEAAEGSAATSGSDDEASNEDTGGRRLEERSASVAFQRDYTTAIAPNPPNSPPSQDRSALVFKEYQSRQHDPPPSAIISKSLPDPVIRDRTPNPTPQNVLPIQAANSPTPKYAGTETTSDEIRHLLRAWTNTADSLVGKYLTESQSADGQAESTSHRAHSHESFLPHETTQDQAHESSQAYRESTARSAEDQRVIIQAWRSESVPATLLVDTFSRFGGEYVWRYEDTTAHWYYVGDRLVLEYQIKPREASSASRQTRQTTTVISRQWVYRDVLKEAGYNFGTSGEGHYVIYGQLTPRDVRKLHVSSSGKKVEWLQKLAHDQPQGNSRQMVKAIWPFDGVRPGDLAFGRCDMFDAEVDSSEQWWKGFKGDRVGIIPANYVELINHPRETERQIVQAKYDFKAQASSQLSFRKGSLFEVDTFRTSDWWWGYVEGAEGSFPPSYVEMLSQV